MKTKISVALTTMALTFSTASFADTLEDKLNKAMSSDIRTEKEIARDDNRMPVETLRFLGIKDDMKVLEMLPGGGWYTKLLAPLLTENGKLYVSLGTRRVKQNLVGQPGFSNMTVLEPDTTLQYNREKRFYDISDFEWQNVEPLDAVLTFRNYHNFTEEGRKTINEAAFKVLKPGGIYGVVDHTRRHMQGLNDENRRRFDPVLAIKEIQEAGFIFVDFSDHLYRADDELRYEVGRKSVTGNTDRFTLLFKKPE